MTERDEHLDERSIQEALEAFEPGADEGAAGEERPEDPERETLLRLHRELWGLLPYALDPVAPSETSRRRVLAAVRAEKRRGRPAPAPAPSGRPDEPTAPPAPDTGPPRRRGGWTLLAATVALAALGLAGWLAIELFHREAVLADLRQALAASPAAETDLAELADDLRGLHEQMAALRESMAIVTSPRVEICPLRPPDPEAPQPAARGLVYFEPVDGRWLATAEGLEPAPAGQVYRLWFLVDGAAQLAGHFTVQPGAPVQLTSAGLPEGLYGIAVTLEPADAVTEAPTGATVLYGAEEEMIRPFEA